MTTPRPGLPADLDRHLARALVREAAAIAPGPSPSRGDKELVDQAAVDAMRSVLGSIAMRGIVVIGAGEKHNAPMLFNSELFGTAPGPTRRWTSRLTPCRRRHNHREEPA